MTEDKENINRFKQIAREEAWQIVEEFVFPIIVDSVNADEAKAVSIKQQVKAIVDSRQARPKIDSFADTEGIAFTWLMGTNGEYEKSEDFENPRFKALLTTLQAHQGKMTADGYFLWIFPDGRAIGRKKKA